MLHSRHDTALADVRSRRAVRPGIARVPMQGPRPMFATRPGGRSLRAARRRVGQHDRVRAANWANVRTRRVVAPWIRPPRMAGPHDAALLGDKSVCRCYEERAVAIVAWQATIAVVHDGFVHGRLLLNHPRPRRPATHDGARVLAPGVRQARSSRRLHVSAMLHGVPALRAVP